MMGHTKVSDAAGKTGQGEYEIELNGTKLSESLNDLRALPRVANLGSFATRFTLPESALLVVTEHRCGRQGFRDDFCTGSPTEPTNDPTGHRTP